MREILFRGQHVDSKEWCYGYLVKQFGATQIYLSRITAHSWDRNHVIPETVGQFTGLVDKSGKKIFEGDIVEYKIGDRLRIGRVFFSDFRSNFSVTAGKNCSDVINNDLYRYIQNGNSVTVIGNIYDNPELIGGGAE